MKRVLLTIALGLFISTAASAQLSFNVKAGAGITTLTTEAKTQVREAFKAGVGMEYAFNDLMSLRTSLNFATKGTRSEIAMGGSNVTVDVNQFYLELPLLVGMRFDVTENTNLILTFGPYIAVGVGGNTAIKGTIGEAGGEQKWSTFGDNGFRRLDAGAAVGLAVELGKFFVGLESEFGFMNVSKDSFYGNDATNFALILGVGYKF